MRPNSRSIASKADIAVSNLVSSGGYLNPEQATAFIRRLIDVPTIIQQCRRVVMSSPQRKIERIGFDSRILRPSPGSGIPLAAANRAAPTTDMITLNTKEFMAEVPIPYDVLEDNIERGGLEGTIMGLITERVALDIEELIINGNTSSSDPYLAMMSGIIARCSSHLVNAAGLADTTMSKLLLREMKKALPTKYLRQLPMLRYFMSHNNEMMYRDQLADRMTGLGDTMVQGFAPVYAYGVPVLPVALMPQTYAVFTHPLNFIWGIQRDIMVETDKDIRARAIIVVVTLRMDFTFEVEDAVVLAQNIASI
jgi:hypothetical protein